MGQFLINANDEIFKTMWDFYTYWLLKFKINLKRKEVIRKNRIIQLKIYIKKRKVQW